MTEPGPRPARDLPDPVPARGLPGRDPAPDLAGLAARLRAAGCVWAEEEATHLLTAAASPAELDAMVARRVSGEPLEHVVGWAEFAGVRVRVAPGIFVPRHRSEALVDVATRLIRERRAGTALERAAAWPGRPGDLTVLDLCAGTGALGLALHARAGPFRLVAVDIDPAAVACARDNLAPMGGVALAGDLFDAVPAELAARIDMVLANAPYVPTAEMALLPHEAREHESSLALDGGSDGLAVHRRLISQAPPWLVRGGTVLIEVADTQVPAALALMTGAGLAPRAEAAPDDPGTVVVTGSRE